MTSRLVNAGATGASWGAIGGLFRSQADAERAIRDLKDAGFEESRIGLAMRDRDSQRELSEDSTGRILGGAVGLLAAVGALAIPGVGPIIAGGTLVGTLSAGPAAGGLVAALLTLGVSEADAGYFETGLRQGNVLVTVNAGSRAQEAYDILHDCGADLGSKQDPSYAGPERRLSHR